MKSPAIFFSLFIFSFNCFGQDTQGISSIVDDLTAQWDEEAKVYKTYEGMKNVCKSQPHRAKTIALVKEIHHYDSVLLKTVQVKYEASKDEEAKATLHDIKKLEEEYTTEGFLKFLHYECSTFNTIEKNYGRAKGKQYDKEIAKMEKELMKYVSEVTSQIDIIDEHMHHLEKI